MKKWILAAMTACFTSLASGHDGGVSELLACTVGDTTVVTWKLHDAKDTNGNWLELGDDSQTQVPLSYQRSGHHHTRLRWRFNALSSDDSLLLNLPGLDRLPYGHRVLASNCDGSRRAVLSQWQKQWRFSGDILAPADASKDSAKPASHLADSAGIKS